MAQNSAQQEFKQAVAQAQQPASQPKRTITHIYSATMMNVPGIGSFQTLTTESPTNVAKLERDADGVGVIVTLRNGKPGEEFLVPYVNINAMRQVVTK